MTIEEQQKIIDEISKEYLHPYVVNIEEEFDSVLEELFEKDARSIIIIGCAYLEDLLKRCFLETMTKEGQKRFLSEHNREITISLTSNLLYSQDYLSKEIFDLINFIRKIRNKYAHKPILSKIDKDSINGLNANLREIIDKRWISRKLEDIGRNKDIDAQLYIIIFENLFLGLLSLNTWIHPSQKLAKLTFAPAKNHLIVSLHVAEISKHTKDYYANKFRNK
tara:strand:+ start:69 stop:734 length:666 start_codon:yes stop_codon:yes gene_type:complete